VCGARLLRSRDFTATPLKSPLVRSAEGSRDVACDHKSTSIFPRFLLSRIESQRPAVARRATRRTCQRRRQRLQRLVRRSAGETATCNSRDAETRWISRSGEQEDAIWRERGARWHRERMRTYDKMARGLMEN
jgi:hypothetical protein